jgi:hypothetical protein
MTRRAGAWWRRCWGGGARRALSSAQSER